MSADGTLRAKAFLGLAQLAVALGVAMFLSAGTMRWVNGWVFLLVFVGASLVVTLYLMKHDPGLLARRLEAGPAAEKRPRQQLIQVFASAGFLGVMIVPASIIATAGRASRCRSSCWASSSCAPA